MRQRGIMTYDQTRKASPSRDRLINDPHEPFKNLANAIVCVAADDYRTALTDGNEQLQSDLEKFFESEWYRTLTTVSSTSILSWLRREHGGTLRAVYT